MHAHRWRLEKGNEKKGRREREWGDDAYGDWFVRMHQRIAIKSVGVKRERGRGCLI